MKNRLNATVFWLTTTLAFLSTACGSLNTEASNSNMTTIAHPGNLPTDFFTPPIALTGCTLSDYQVGVTIGEQNF